MWPPISAAPGSLARPRSISSRTLVSVGSTRTRWKSLESAPTFSEMLIPLSFSTTVIGDLRWPAWFRPSYAMPPVSAPSPMTQTTWPSWRPWRPASASPVA